MASQSFGAPLAGSSQISCFKRATLAMVNWGDLNAVSPNLWSDRVGVWASMSSTELLTACGDGQFSIQPVPPHSPRLLLHHSSLSHILHLVPFVGMLPPKHTSTTPFRFINALSMGRITQKGYLQLVYGLLCRVHRHPAVSVSCSSNPMDTCLMAPIPVFEVRQLAFEAGGFDAVV